MKQEKYQEFMPLFDIDPIVQKLIPTGSPAPATVQQTGQTESISNAGTVLHTGESSRGAYK